jgi:hypothetical protein
MKELLIILLPNYFSYGIHKGANFKEAEIMLEQVCSTSTADKFVFHDRRISSEIWSDDKYKKCVQMGSDEQEQILNAFVKGFLKKYESIVLIKSNVKDIRPEIISNAFSQLRSNDYVTGPSTDGSFYLLGMKKMETALFEEECSYKEIISILNAQKSTFYEMQVLEGVKEEKSGVGNLFREQVRSLQMISRN